MGIKLKTILEQLMKEQGVGMAPFAPMPPVQLAMGMGVPPINPMPPIAPMVPPPAAPPPQVTESAPQPLGDRDIVELGDINMSVTVLLGEKKLLFAPQDHYSMTEKVKRYVNLFKNNFRISDINLLEKGNFEIEFDPRENFTLAIEFLQKLSQHENRAFI